MFPFLRLCEIIIIQSLNDIEKGLNWRGKVEDDVMLNNSYDLLLITQQNVGWAKVVDNKS